MAQSTEYPDLKWVSPRSWSNANRTSVQVIVIHTTEGSEHGQSAEDGAAYDARRTDGTSTHYFHDSNSTVQCVRTEDKAHTARANGNRIGIQHELCGDAGDSAAEWADTYHEAMLRVVAKQCARDAKKWGIPVRKITPTQVRAGVKGFCGHVDITNAFPEDKGTHTDPGRNFPWTHFLALVQEELAPEEEKDIMAELVDFMESVGRAARSEESATAQDRRNRDNLAAAGRFMLGYNAPYDMSKLPAGVLNRMAEALESLVAGADGSGPEPGQ